MALGPVVLNNGPVLLWQCLHIRKGLELFGFRGKKGAAEDNFIAIGE